MVYAYLATRAVALPITRMSTARKFSLLTPRIENIEIRLVKPDDAQSLTDYVKSRISNDGTALMTRLKPPQHEIDYIAQHLLTDVLAKPDKINSFVAIDKTKGAIVGCLLMFFKDRKDGHSEPDFSGRERSAISQSRSDFHRLMWSGFLEFLPENYSGPYLFMELVLVEPEYRRLGLMRNIYLNGYRRAWVELGCRYGFVNCSTYKTQKFGEQEGWTTLRWINYEDYYVLGKKVFDFGKDSNEKCSKLMLVDIKKCYENHKAKP